jgi:hypothetical protein
MRKLPLIGKLFRKKEDPKPKPGFLYQDAKEEIKPLDLLLFKGGDFVSNAIRFLEYVQLDDDWADDFSHAGLVVTKDILDDDRLEEGVLYVWESTMSGKLGQNIYNMKGKAFLGVQLRNFDVLIEAYDEPNNTRIAFCPLRGNPYDDVENRPQLKQKFTEIFTKYNGTRYDLNLYSLLSALYPRIRFLRPKIEKFLNTEDWLFCSELCALVYKELDVLPSTVNEKNVLPVDFITGVDEDSEIPNEFVGEPVYIVTQKHLQV